MLSKLSKALRTVGVEERAGEVVHQEEVCARRMVGFACVGKQEKTCSHVRNTLLE
jgi:hypothetical protein